MSFQAGSVLASLGLDNSGFSSGMLQAEGLMRLFPGWVTSFMANPLLGMAEVFSQFLSFSTLNEIATQLDNIGESAAKAGVSVGLLSGLQLIAEDAGGSAEAVSGALKFLNKNLAEAADTSSDSGKRMAGVFQQLGVSGDLLASQDTGAIFLAVADGISKIQSPAQRTNVAMELLGRGAEDMLLVLSQGSGGIQQQISRFEALGAVVTDTQAQIGDKVSTLGLLFSSAMDGIRRAVAEPVMQIIATHAVQLEAALVGVTAVIRSGIAAGFEFVSKHGQLLTAVVVGLAAAAATALVPALVAGASAALALVPAIAPLTALIAGLAGAVAGFTVFGEASSLMGQMQAVGMTLWQVMSDLWAVFDAQLVPVISQAMTQALNALSPLMSSFIGLLASLAPIAQLVGLLLIEGFKNAARNLSILSTVLAPVIQVVAYLVDLVSLLVRKLGEVAVATAKFFGIGSTGPALTSAAEGTSNSVQSAAAASQPAVNVSVNGSGATSAEVEAAVNAGVKKAISENERKNKRSYDANNLKSAAQGGVE